MDRLLAGLFLLMAACATSLGGDLRVGTAAVRITPPVGAPMAGYYYTRTATGVHDDLNAKAIVLESGGVKAAMVACDITGLPRVVIQKARELIRQSTGIPAERVMISATHAHTAPIVLTDRVRDRLEGETLRIAREYADALPGKIAESVRQANANLAPAQLSAGIGHEASLAFNRRYFMKDGTVGWNPGKLNPNIVKPAGPIDPDVNVLLFQTAEGRPLITYVNYAMHLDTVGGLEISADYPYTLSSLLARIEGPEMLTMFTIGTAGNINHVDVSTKVKQNGHGEAARIGTVLAGEVLKTYTRLNAVNADGVRTRDETVSLPAAPIAAGDLEWARGVAARYGEHNAAPFLDFVRAFRVLDVAALEGKPVAAEVQVIALGKDVAWVGLPGEIFVELGQAIKKASPFAYTVIVELANDSIGYVPNREAYPQGAYEVVSTRCAPGSGEMLVDAAVRLLKTLSNE